MSSPPGRSSRLLVSGAVLALILVASLAVVVIDSYPTTDPLQRDLVRPGSAPLPKQGVMVLRMLSNQDFSSIVAAPFGSPRPVSRWPIQVVTINSSIISLTPLSLTTSPEGIAFASFLPGLYLVEVPYNTLNIQIPVVIYGGNTTSVQLNVSESAHPLLYSEAADVGGQTSVYVDVGSTTPAAGVGSLVTIGAESGAAQSQTSALVVSALPPTAGTEWLKVESEGGFDIASATSAVLATWSYSSSVSVAPTQGSLAIEE